MHHRRRQTESSGDENVGLEMSMASSKTKNKRKEKLLKERWREKDGRRR
jgi:hypothetical protein